ncbi:MAG: hypothetical protein ACJ74G_05490, partial [Blastocatellia bacterium]
MMNDELKRKRKPDSFYRQSVAASSLNSSFIIHRSSFSVLTILPAFRRMQVVRDESQSARYHTSSFVARI